MIEQTYKLNMIPRAEQDFRSYEPPVVHISQYDKVLRTLRFELYDGKDPFTIPENTAAYIYGMKPDGNAFQYQMDITEDGLLQIDVQTQMATVAGCVTCEVILFEGNESGNRIGSANFKMAVEKAAVGDDAQFSESDMPVIQTLLFGGTPGDILVKDVNGVKWNSEPHSVGYMRYDQYDPDRTGTVNSARDSETVDGHTVARNVLSDEYTNTEIDGKVQAVQDDVDALNSSAVKSVNTITPVNGNVTLSKSDVGLGNVDNTSDLSKPISTATQSALDEKVDKVTGKGLSTNDFTDAEKTKLANIEAGAQVNTITGVKGNSETSYRTGNVNITKANIGLGNVNNTADADKPISTATQSALDQKVDKVAGKGLSTKDFTSAEKTKLAGIEAGAQVNTVTGVKGNAEAAYRTGDVNITKANIGLGNVDNTSDLDKPISTAVQNELTALNSNLSQKVSSVNGETPDTNGNVSLNAEDIPADGVGSKDVSGNPIIVTDAVAENAQNLSVDLEPIQDLHGYDKPWAGGAGKNLFDFEGWLKANNVTYTKSGNSFTFSTTSALFGNPFSFSAENIDINFNVSVTLGTATNLGFVFLDKDGTAITGRKSSKTTVQGASKVRMDWSASGTVTITEPIISIDDVPFEPYSNICPITGRTSVDVTRTGKNLCSNASDIHLLMSPSGVMDTNARCDLYYFPTSLGTVTIFADDITLISDDIIRTGYVDEIPTNGTVGVRAGNMQVNHRTYELNTDYKYFVVMLLWRSTSAKTNVQVEVGSSATSYEEYKEQSVTVQLGQTVYGGTLNVTTGELTVETANIASYNGETIGEPWWSSMDEYVEGATPTTGAQVVYTLATPTTVSLTPAQLALLEGYNILTTDGDTINLRYTGTVASNVQSEIDEFEESTRTLAGSLAMVETSPATANHAVGSYLMLNNRLCKVTSPIATGEQIIVGSNVQYTTVAEELATILAQINA